MVNAYILIVVNSGAEQEVLNELLSIDEIEDASIVYGEYDVIAKIKVEDVSQLNDFLLEVIRPIQGIERTSTLISYT